MVKCRICGFESEELPASIGICRECLRREPDVVKMIDIHRKWRSDIGLPEKPPNEKGIKCPICVNECIIPEGSVGYCGVIANKGGRLVNIAGDGYSLLHWYLDSLPTNCVADPVCPASSSRGYPRFSPVPGPEYGFYNLAIFFGGCNLDCLFCQNIEHKYIVTGYRRGEYKIYRIHWRDLVDKAMDDKVTCICFFGGDPTPHILYALKVSKEIHKLSLEKGVIKRICWETNGLVNPVFMKQMTILSRDSGGIVKIDWKAWTPSIYQALTGVNGSKALDRLRSNTRLVYEVGGDREDPPILVVSILIVPHYIDYYEVYHIVSYIASISPDIPIVLLGFHPHHLMRDIPTTSWEQMNEAVKAIKDAGIKEYYIGNKWLLRV